jgi:hypothetical protein
VLPLWIPTQNAANGTGISAKFVMPGLVPGIHVLTAQRKKNVDCRDKPGHDEKRIVFTYLGRS